MRICIGILMFLFYSVVSSNATPVSKVGFRAYSSPSSVICNVFGMKRYTSPATPAQVFTPDPSLSRSYSLGTKGFANYSTPVKSTGVFVIRYSCTITGTPNVTPVKFYLNEVETYFLTTGSGEFGINP